jgi:subtilisin
MLLLLIVFSSQNLGSIRNSYAFDFRIPDIPFLNFNFNYNNDRSDKKDEIDSAVISPDEKTDTPVLYFEEKNEINVYDSLPFPSNAVNTAMYAQAENREEEESTYNTHELNQISSHAPDTLPLISDYTDFPSNFLLDSDAEVGKEIPNQFIVVLKEDNTALSEILSTISENIEFQGVEVLQVYEEVLSGIAIKVPNEQVIESIENLPMVDYVENDIIAEAFDQTISTGINRIDADMSSANPRDGNRNIHIDIAIIDSGIDLKHSDLNVYHQKSFVNSNTGLSSFFGMRATAPTGDDDNGHGTHVAGIAAAKDNSMGSVGVAPGAKLWAIKVLDNNGTGPLSTIIKGIDYITKYSDEIEVANLSLGCECKSSAFDTAINNSVKTGIVFVVAAGNAGKDAMNTSPSNNPNVISVSAVADSDGKCGGQGSNTGYGPDDSLATFSNYGSVIDIAAPGAKIYSTYKGNTYATMSGTSMASPHVAGAAALYLAINPDASPSMVKSALLNEGSKVSSICEGSGFGYFSGDKDQIREPLLYVKNY